MSRTPFVGRTAELSTLGQLARRAAAGRATAVVVSGPAGVGKSALLSAFLDSSPEHQVVRLHGDEIEQDLPYATLEVLLGSGSSGWVSPFTAGAEALRILGELCERGPVICAVDDAHLCDVPSLTAINFMVRRMRSDPLLLVLAVRPEGGSRLPSALAGQVGEWITLQGLSVHAVRDLSAELGRPRLSWHAASRVQAHTEGNPFHLRALLDEVPVEALEDLSRPIPAPASLAQLVVTELSRLSPAAQRVAAAASVLGDRPRIARLVEVAEVSPGEALDACEELSRAGILRVPPGSGSGKFAHPLVRSAIYDDLGPATRAALHTRAARSLTGSAALEHRVHAAFGPDPALAAELEIDGQDDAAHGRLLRAARSLLQSARLSLPGSEADQRFLAGVAALLMDGDVGAAQAQSSSLQSLPPTGRRLAVEAQMAWLSGHAGLAVRLGREAWALAGDLPAQELDTLAAMLAKIEVLRDNPDEAARWAARALRSGRLDPAATPHIRAVQCFAVGLHGRPEEGLALLDDLAADPGNVPLPQHPELAERGILRAITGDLAAADADLAVSGSLQHGDFAPFRLTASAAHAEVLVRRGYWDSAQQTVEHVLGLAEDMGQVWLTGYIHAVGALVPAARGDWQRARDHVEAAHRVAHQLEDRATKAYAANAGVYLAAHRGDPQAVLAAARPLRQLPISAPPVKPGMMSWPVHVICALVELGLLDEAQAELATRERLAREQDNPPGLFSAAWLAGAVAAAQRDSGRARRAFDQSLEMGDDRIDAVEQILARFHHGRFLRRRGERRKAAGLLHEARARASGLLAAPLVSRCEGELAACGVLATETVAPTATVLTPQEHVIAALVCKGHSNREIAAKLVLSPKTVGYHLSNVYAKLGVHSRVQLAQALQQP